MPFSSIYTDAVHGAFLKVSVVVVTYWTGPALRECLESIRAQESVGEILIVDNGNGADTKLWLYDVSQTDSRLKVLDPGKNIGFAAGCNFGAAAARYDLLAFVNPDMVLPPGTLVAVQGIMASRPDAWLCGGRLLNMDGTEQRGGRREILSPWRAFIELTRLNRLFPNHPYFRRLHLYENEDVTATVEVPTVSGAFMMIEKATYERVGGMDENLFLHFDDADLCIRIVNAGGKILYCGTVPVYHHLSTSDASRTFIEWHKTRSTDYYFHKHFSATYPSWALTVTSLLLWVRFLVMMAVALPQDTRLMMRRWFGAVPQTGSSRSAAAVSKTPASKEAPK